MTFFIFACQKDGKSGRVHFGLKITDQYSSSSRKVIMSGTQPYFIENESIKINGESYLIDYRTGSASVFDVTEEDNYYAIYPASWVNGSASASPSITFPSTQTYKTDNNGNQVIETPMVAFCTNGNNTLNFHNAAALVTIHLTNRHPSNSLKVKYVAIYTDNTPLSGPANITGITGGEPSISILDGGNTSIIIDCSQLHTLTTSGSDMSADVTFAVPPIINKNLYVNVYLTSENGSTKYWFTQKTNQSKTILRNQLGEINVTIDGDLTSTGEFWGAGTSANDPYIIKDKTDLQRLKELVNNIDYNSSSKFYRQIANIDLSEETAWTGIGTSTNPFAANYDGGNSYTKINIGNLSSLSNGVGLGLFGTVGGGGSIKNLRITGRIAAQARNTFVGTFAGKVVGSFTFDACKNDVPLNTHGNSNYTNPYGGICGCIDANGCTVEVKNCKNFADIKRYSYSNIGGICGAVNAGTVIFTSDTNAGTLSTSTSVSNYYSGGICGYTAVATTFINCVNEGIVSSESYGVGGILGKGAGGTFTGCRNTTTVSGSYTVGGIVGNTTAGTTISQCINTGSVVASGSEKTRGVAGIIVHVSGGDISISQCINTATITVSSGGQNLYAGGILGLISAGTSLSITDCGNKGTIDVNKAFAAAGIVGQIRAGNPNEITNCYSTGNIKRTGISTHAAGIVTTENSSSASVTNCYFSGEFTGTGSVTNYGDIGCKKTGTITTTKTYSKESYSGTNCVHSDYTISISESNYITNRSKDESTLYTLLDALNEGRGSYSKWTTKTKDGEGKPVYTELPILSWE